MATYKSFDEAENVKTVTEPANPNKIEMTMTEALSRMTMLKKRLSQEDSLKNLYAIVAGAETKLPNGETQEEYDIKIKAAWQQYMALFENYKRLKRAINVCNMRSTIEFMGETYGVAEVLAMRSDGVITKYKSVIANLKNAYSNMVKENTRTTNAYQNSLNEYLKEMGAKQMDAIAAGAEIPEDSGYRAAVEFYEKKNKPVLLDPINLKEQIDKLEDFVNEFETNLDFKLSEFNATKTIVVEFVS